MSSRRNTVIRTVAALCGDIAVGVALATACGWVIEAAALGLFLSFLLWLVGTLLALAIRITGNNRFTATIAVLGIFAAALFYGDSILTPAISVLSAVEGLGLVAPALATYVVPLTLLILTALFLLAFLRRVLR